HRRLQVVALLAGDAQLVAVDLGVDLQLGGLDLVADLLRHLALDALLHGDLLARAGEVAFHVAELEAAGIDLPRRQACAQDVGHLLQLEVARRALGDHRVLALEGGIHALEIEASGQLAVGLVDGIGQLVGVDFRDDVEGRHGAFSPVETGGSGYRNATAAALVHHVRPASPAEARWVRSTRVPPATAASKPRAP